MMQALKPLYSNVQCGVNINYHQTYSFDVIAAASQEQYTKKRTDI